MKKCQWERFHFVGTFPKDLEGNNSFLKNDILRSLKKSNDLG